MNEKERLNVEGRALLRVARELRGFLSGAPNEDPDLQSLLSDVKVVEDIGRWLAGAAPIVALAELDASYSKKKAS